MVTFMGITAIAVVIASCNLFALYLSMRKSRQWQQSGNALKTLSCLR